MNWQSIATTVTPMGLLGLLIVWYIRTWLPRQQQVEAERRALELATYERSLARVVEEAKATRVTFEATVDKLEERLDQKDAKIIEILQQRMGGQ